MVVNYQCARARALDYFRNPRPSKSIARTIAVKSISWLELEPVTVKIDDNDGETSSTEQMNG